MQNEIIEPIIDDFVRSEYEGMEVYSYAPETQDGPLPVVVWNHGGGETYRNINGVENFRSQLFANYGGVGWILNAPEDAIVIAIQRGQPDGVYTQQKVVDYVQTLIDAGLADEDRIYTGGCSAGGSETWRFMLDDTLRPFFAAFFTNPGGNNSDAETLAKLVDTPLWMVNTGDDTLASTQAAFEKLSAMGADVKWTHFESGTNGAAAGYPGSQEEGGYDDHWSWVQCLNDFYSEEYETGFMEWIFAQTSRVRMGVFAPDYLDIDYGSTLSYAISAGRIRPTNTIEITAQFDAANLSYVNTTAAQGWSIPKPATYNAATGEYKVVINWLAQGQTFSSESLTELVNITFVNKAGNGATIDGLLASGTIVVIDPDSSARNVSALLEPAGATTNVISIMRLDFNNDGVIGLDDVSAYIYRYYLASEGDEGWDEVGENGWAPVKIFDLNGDGTIDLVDILIVYVNV